MNYNGPKVKISRKLGIDITPKASKVKQKKSYPPGQHGNSRRRPKQSDYGKQLLEKQRLRMQYNLSEKQMRNYYKKATSLTGNSGEILMQLIESRLDALVLRSGMVRTIYQARQFIGHGHVTVNGRKMDVPSYHVQVNDVIGFKAKTQKNDMIQDSIRNANPPAYIELSKADFNFKYIYTPPREEIPAECDIPLVVEYYSR